MCPSKHQNRAAFTVIPRNRPISIAFYDAHFGYGGPILILNPRVPKGALWKYSIEKRGIAYMIIW